MFSVFSKKPRSPEGRKSQISGHMISRVFVFETHTSAGYTILWTTAHHTNMGEGRGGGRWPTQITHETFTIRCPPKLLCDVVRASNSAILTLKKTIGQTGRTIIQQRYPRIPLDWDVTAASSLVTWCSSTASSTSTSTTAAPTLHELIPFRCYAKEEDSQEN